MKKVCTLLSLFSLGYGVGSVISFYLCDFTDSTLLLSKVILSVGISITLAILSQNDKSKY